MGSYTSPDPLGAVRRRRAGHLYAYARSNPLLYLEPLGLAEFCCRTLGGWAGYTGQKHCFLRGDDGTTYSLFPEFWFPTLVGVPQTDAPGDAQAPDAECSDCEGCSERSLERCLTRETVSYPIGTYDPFGPNSNTFAGQLARKCCGNGEDIVTNTTNAPGLNDDPPDD